MPIRSTTREIGDTRYNYMKREFYSSLHLSPFLLLEYPVRMSKIYTQINKYILKFLDGTQRYDKKNIHTSIATCIKFCVKNKNTSYRWAKLVWAIRVNHTHMTHTSQLGSYEHLTLFFLSYVRMKLNEWLTFKVSIIRFLTL